MNENVTKLKHPDYSFPADVTAYDATLERVDSPYRFGLNTNAAIAAIRKLADGMENGDYLLQACESSQKADIQDYTTSTITIRWAQKKEAGQVIEKSLSAND